MWYSFHLPPPLLKANGLLVQLPLHCWFDRVMLSLDFGLSSLIQQLNILDSCLGYIDCQWIVLDWSWRIQAFSHTHICSNKLFFFTSYSNISISSYSFYMVGRTLSVSGKTQGRWFLSGDVSFSCLYFCIDISLLTNWYMEICSVVICAIMCMWRSKLYTPFSFECLGQGFILMMMLLKE